MTNKKKIKTIHDRTEELMAAYGVRRKGKKPSERIAANFQKSSAGAQNLKFQNSNAVSAKAQRALRI